MKKLIKVPDFKDEKEEVEFWNNLDLTEYFDTEDFERVTFPNLKPTTKAISIRLPEYLINRLKEKANMMDIPYQSLIKNILHDSLKD